MIKLADKFFEDEKQSDTTETAETVKVGDKEYTQEELGKLVGLGNTALEAETKYGRSIDKFWPEFTKAQQKSIEMEKELNDLKSFRERLQAPEQKVLSQEEQYAQARAQAREIGLTDEETTRRIYREERQAEKLIDEIDGLNAEAKTTGKPEADKEKLIKYMVDEGFRSPVKAYRDMYENELKDWETKQIETIKSQGYQTQETTTAGSKYPTIETPKTADELKSALNTLLNSSDGAENA